MWGCVGVAGGLRDGEGILGGHCTVCHGEAADMHGLKLSYWRAGGLSGSRQPAVFADMHVKWASGLLTRTLLLHGGGGLWGQSVSKGPDFTSQQHETLALYESMQACAYLRW